MAKSRTAIVDFTRALRYLTGKLSTMPDYVLRLCPIRGALRGSSNLRYACRFHEFLKQKRGLSARVHHVRDGEFLFDEHTRQ